MDQFDLKNVTKSYRPHYVIGIMKSIIEQSLYMHDANYYRKELLKMHMIIQEYEDLHEKEKEYNGVF